MIKSVINLAKWHWLLAVPLVATLFVTGSLKLLGTEPDVPIFAHYGLTGELPVFGVIQLTAGFLYIFKPTQTIGFGMGCAYFGVVTVLDYLIENNPFVPVAMLTLFILSYFLQTKFQLS